MSEEKKKKTAKEPPTVDVSEQSEAQKTTEDSSLTEAELALREAQERILRISAEYDNYKKRTAKEKEELYSAAAADVLTKLLFVFDNLERAYTCTDFDSLKKGVDMILDSFHAALGVCNVTEIEALGKPFDPMLHCAVMQEEGTEYEENTVCDVLQKGYMLGDKVLRHAMVKVAQ